MVDPVVLGETPSEAAALVDEAAWAAARAYRRAPHTAVEETARLRWLITGMPYSGLNGVFWAGNGKAGLVDTALGPFQQAEVPMLWHVGPTSSPGLADRVRSAGLRHHGDEPGMVRTLEGAERPPEAPWWLELRRVGTVSELRAWVRIWAGATSPLLTERLVALRSPAAFGAHARTVHFLGVADGDPVACAAVWLGRLPTGRRRTGWQGRSVAWVEHVTTLPDARGRGIGAALTYECLRAAAERQAELAALTATPEAAPLYRRLGFRQVCTFSRYLWTP